MKKKDFFTEIAEVLELSDSNINELTAISLDSMQILSLIAFVDEKFEKQLKITELKGVKLISDLMLAIGAECFTD